MYEFRRTDTYGEERSEHEFGIDEPDEINNAVVDHESQGDTAVAVQSQGTERGGIHSRKRKSNPKDGLDAELAQVLKQSISSLNPST